MTSRITRMFLLALLAASGREHVASAQQAASAATIANVNKSARILIDQYMRDPSICVDSNGTYYLTGTTLGQNQIQIWKSTNLKDWDKLDFSWTYGDSAWHQNYKTANSHLWAPEIHYMKNTFWLTYSMPGYDGTAATSGSGVLRSTTGAAMGPYVDVQPDARLGDEIDASLFQDDDGSAYYVWHCGKIAKMKSDMSGLAEEGRKLAIGAPDPDPAHHSGLCAQIHGEGSFDHIGYEGAFLFKRNGTYYLSGSDHCDGRYSCWVATSKDIYGPYSARYEAVPYGGHNMFFKDNDGQWWSTIFNGPVFEKPAIVPIGFDADGRIIVAPEPHALALLATGSAGMLTFGWLKRR